MRALTVVGLSVLGMLSTSGAVLWTTAPTPAAQAATAAKPPARPAPGAVVSLPGALALEARAGHAVLPASGRPETHLLFRLTAAGVTSSRQPVHVVALVDRSGSMRGRRLDNALSAARGLVSRLSDGDRITLLAYDTRVTTLLPTVSLDAASRARALARLEDRAAAGNTCISCGLEAALRELEGSKGHLQHVLLLSDGEATAGERGLEGFQRIARRARDRGISVSSIGIDLDYNEALLSTLARFSNGQHHFARDAAELGVAFDREMAALSQTALADVTLDVELPAGVELVRVFDREVELEGQRLRVRLGSFAAAEEKTLLLQVRLPEGGPRDATLATFGLGYRTSGSAHESSGSLGVRTSDSLAKPGELDPVVAARVLRGRTGAVLFEAGKLFKSGSPEDFAAADQKLGAELESVRRGAAGAGADKADLNRQAQALESAQARLRQARGQHCGCAAGDLSCATKCSATGKTARPSPKRCAPGDPLCGDVGELSPSEKAAAKESVGASNPFRK